MGMFLRSLQIRGFKSFADRTTLEFAPGISCVVGPNGSGKSNLVDAIAWVLGEQGPRALRGSQMADVIFAGSPGRPALGTAEVTLVIDNSEGLIPVPLTEIEISRVVYRSGDSQYLIGGKSVRLMDIQELLSDTGIGRALHTVVGQGQLEDVLISKPEDRRQFIEEAAGIAKHRKRKERAQRKLASLEQDLLRLQDVMGELRRQLKPLKQQAEVAQRHQKFSEEAESLSWRLAAARLRDLERQHERHRSTWEEGQARRRQAEERLRSLDAEIATLGRRLGDTERALREAEQAEAGAIRARSEAEAALRDAVKTESEARSRLTAEAGRSGRLFSLEEEVRRTEEALDRSAAALEAREREAEQAERVYRSAEQARRDAEEERRTAREAAAARRAEAEGHRRSLAASEAERARLEQQLEDLRRRESDAASELKAAEKDLERMGGELEQLTRRGSDLDGKKRSLLAEVESLEADERGLDIRRQAMDARRKALAVTPGKRFLSRGRERALGLLGTLVKVNRGMERAVSAALGEWVDAVVYENHRRAVADAGDAAGATIAVAGGDAPSQNVLPGERPLLSVVDADPRVRGLLSRLLRGVYLARDPADALARHRAHPEASFVAPDGVLVGPSVVRTAPADDEEERKLRAELEVVQGELERTRGRLEERRVKLEDVSKELGHSTDGAAEAEARMAATSKKASALSADVFAAERERQFLSERLARVEEAAEAARRALAAVPEEPELRPLPQAPESPMGVRVDVEATRRERTRLEEGLRRARAELERLRAEDPETLGTQADAARAALAEAEESLRRAEEAATATAARREEASAAAAEARSAEIGTNEQWREAAALLQRLRDEYEEEDTLRRDLERRIAEAGRVLSEGHRKDPAEAVAALGDEDTVETLQKRADLVARRLALLGRVNLVATEEFHSLQERHDFLQREIDDVRAARRDLNEVVREVDRKIVEVFEEAFHDVAAEFTRIFSTVFPGGEGKLSLTDPGDPLGTGIEIEARPGRKKVKRISLLSGGERALTAISFLFAIFSARPSPFYLLDEVEAALDDVNLHRFIQLVRDFAQRSQVLVVTHQKRTMEAADILYGVSMGKEGATAVITQRISEAVAASAE